MRTSHCARRKRARPTRNPKPAQERQAMHRLRTIGFVICLCAAFAAIPAAAQTTSLKDSIAQQEQKLAQARASKDMRAILTELNILGSLYRTSGQLQKALEVLNEALPIEQQANSLLRP